MSSFAFGLALLLVAGTLAGGSAAPIKAMRRLDYEHWALLSTITVRLEGALTSELLLLEAID